MKKKIWGFCVSGMLLASLSASSEAAKFDFDSPEAQEARKACFEKYDLNKDGVLSWDEIRAGLESQKEQELIKRYDLNSDGVLSEDEKVQMLKDIENKKQKQREQEEKNRKNTAVKTTEQEAQEVKERAEKEWHNRILRFDKDGDGKLSVEEYASMRESEFIENKKRNEKAKEDAEKNLLNRCVQDKCSIPVAFFKPDASKEAEQPKKAEPENKASQPKEPKQEAKTAVADTGKKQISPNAEPVKKIDGDGKTIQSTASSSAAPSNSTVTNATTERAVRASELDKGNGPTLTH